MLDEPGYKPGTDAGGKKSMAEIVNEWRVWPRIMTLFMCYITNETLVWFMELVNTGKFTGETEIASVVTGVVLTFAGIIKFYISGAPAAGARHD